MMHLVPNVATLCFLSPPRPSLFDHAHPGHRPLQVMNVLALSALAMVIFHPEMLRRVQLEGAPQSGNLSAVGADEPLLPPRVMPKYGPTYSVFGGQVWNVDDLNIGIMITFCTFVITLLMVVGAIKGQPSYLMPFFCLQVFDFCISR